MYLASWCFTFIHSRFFSLARDIEVHLVAYMDIHSWTCTYQVIINTLRRNKVSGTKQWLWIIRKMSLLWYTMIPWSRLPSTLPHSFRLSNRKIGKKKKLIAKQISSTRAWNQNQFFFLFYHHFPLHYAPFIKDFSTRIGKRTVSIALL